MYKRIVVAALLVCVCVLFVGCGVKMSFVNRIAAGGERTNTLTVTFDETVTDEQKTACYDYLQDIASRRRQAGRNTSVSQLADCCVLTESFESATDYYIAMGYTGNEPNDNPLPQEVVDGYFVEYTNVMSLCDNATVLGYALQYACIENPSTSMGWRAQLMLLAMGEDDLAQVATTLLLATDVVEATVQALDDSAELQVELNGWLATLGYDLALVPFEYAYDHIYDTVYAKQYDDCYLDRDGATVYVWNMTLADLGDKQITIYQKAPRVWVWEVTAIGAGLLAAAIVAVIIIVKRRKSDAAKRQDGQEIQG